MLLCARYVLPVSRPHIENGAVLVQGGKIIDIGYSTKLRTQYPNEEIKDFGLAALMPGFVDAHTHMQNSVMRGLISDAPYAAWNLLLAEKDKLLTNEDRVDSSMLGALETIRSGITTVADIAPSDMSMQAAKLAGLRGIFYREVGTMERSEVDSALDHAFADIERWRQDCDTNMITVGIAPSALFVCHPMVFKGVAEYAQDGTPVACHIAGSREEYEFIRYGSSPFSVHSREQERGFGIDMPPWLATGVSPVNYILNWGLLDVPNLLAIHCVHVNDADIDKLAENDIAIAICPRCNAQLGMGVAPLQKFIEAEIRVGLGTDSPAATSTSDPLSEMRIGLLMQRALGNRSNFFTATEMVRLATLGSAEALRLDDKVGSLEAGKCADIIALDLSNSNQAPTHDPNSAIVHTATQDNILMTMINGEILYDGHNHLHDVDVERVFARAEEMRLKLKG